MTRQQKTLFMGIKNWVELCKSFLDSNNLVGTSASLNTPLKDLSQWVGECVIDYNAMSMLVFNKYYDKHMDQSQDVTKPLVYPDYTDYNSLWPN